MSGGDGMPSSFCPTGNLSGALGSRVLEDLNFE